MSRIKERVSRALLTRISEALLPSHQQVLEKIIDYLIYIAEDATVLDVARNFDDNLAEVSYQLDDMVSNIHPLADSKEIEAIRQLNDAIKTIANGLYEPVASVFKVDREMQRALRIIKKELR